MKKQTVCLNMIVKNESRVIKRCLDAVKPLIDMWAIVDTGSTDGTQGMVRDIMSGIPGELYERPWRDFGSNRTEALDFARSSGADYAMVIDADEVISYPPGFSFPELSNDAYMTPHEIGGGTRFYLIQLLKCAMPWRYECVLHEVATCDEPHSIGRIEEIICRGMFDSARNQDPDKYAKDAAILEIALEKDPDNSRYVFYLAQSYRDSDQMQKAVDAYQRRASMGGWDEEVWYSMFQIGVLLERLGRFPESLAAYLRAYQYRPSRAEPLYELSRRYRELNEYHVAYLFASKAASIPCPKDSLFLDSSTYDWRANDELSISAYYTGDYEISLAAYDKLLSSGKVPPSEIQRVVANQQFSLEKCGPRQRGDGRDVASPMKIAVILPSRGSPHRLTAILTALDHLSSGSHEVRYHVFVDDDDEATITAMHEATKTLDGIRLEIGSGAISHFERINRTCRDLDAEVLTWFTDDVFPLALHWDATIALEIDRGCAALAWTEVTDPNHVTFPILSRRWLDVLGYVFPEYFPFWFVDTWVMETYELAFCQDFPIVRDLPVGGRRGTTGNMHDLRFWYDFFDATRSERLRDARRLGAAFHSDATEHQMEEFAALHHQRVLNQMERIPEFERRFGAGSRPKSARYERLKADADRWIEKHAKL